MGHILRLTAPRLLDQRGSINNPGALREIRSTSAADFTDTKQQSRCEPKQQTQRLSGKKEKGKKTHERRSLRDEAKQRVSETKGPLECDRYENTTAQERQRPRKNPGRIVNKPSAA